jgi:putative transposase
MVVVRKPFYRTKKEEGPMKSLARKRRKWKAKVISKRKALEEVMALKNGIDDIDVKVEMIQALIPLGLSAVSDNLQKEFLSLVGKKHARGKENMRWGSQGGSVYLADQKVPITVPRVRNKMRNMEVPLEFYQKMQAPYLDGEQAFKRLLNGLSTHKYRESAEFIPEVFGLSASSASRGFKRVSAAKLKQLQERRLDKYDIVAVFVDGKRYAEDGLMVILGITSDGQKVVLGIEQMATENHRPIVRAFEKLIERGLRYDEGLLFIIDGSKGIVTAIRQVFRACGVIQRCQYHKIENVVGYLPKGIQTIWRKRLQDAYKVPEHETARNALTALYNELYDMNPSAASSLKEGFEETLTLHRLELRSALAKSFSSTNCIESIMSQLGQYTNKVDRWRGRTHIQRWAASGLLALEPRLNKVRGFRHLQLLKTKLLEEVTKRQKKEALECPANDFIGTGIHSGMPQI